MGSKLGSCCGMLCTRRASHQVMLKKRYWCQRPANSSNAAERPECTHADTLCPVQEVHPDEQAGNEDPPPEPIIESVVKELEHVQHTVSVDMDVNAVTTSRADNTMHVAYNTGDKVVMWSDGSRTICWSDGSWSVEIEGLPRVHGKQGKTTCDLAIDTSVVWHSDSDAITLCQQGACNAIAVHGRLSCGMQHCSLLVTWHVCHPLPVHINKKQLDGVSDTGLGSASDQKAQQDILMNTDSTWTPELVSGKSPLYLIADLVTGQWAIQDDKVLTKDMTAVSFDGEMLHGFEPFQSGGQSRRQDSQRTHMEASEKEVTDAGEKEIGLNP
jgi:hypothetical protein